MKAFVILPALLAVATAQEFCYKDVVQACLPSTSKQSTALENCSARYGSIDAVSTSLQAFANTHITRSYEYLLMSTHYANYEKNREGFEKLFRGLSDHKWHKAIELIKYIAKRGGKMDFYQRKEDKVNVEPNYELYEIQSLAKALDMEKELALDAFAIHDQAMKRRRESHDPEISSYIEEEFVHQQADTIRKLSGYASDLNSLLRSPDSSLSLYLFDEYLQKN